MAAKKKLVIEKVVYNKVSRTLANKERRIAKAAKITERKQARGMKVKRGTARKLRRMKGASA